jgi:hypothetical protein
MINLNDATPAAPGGGVNVKWQQDGSGNISAYLSISGIPQPVENEVVTFSGTSGTLANTPNLAAGYTQVKLYRNGVRLNPGGGNDFTWSGTTITLTTAAGGSDLFLADYYK